MVQNKLGISTKKSMKFGVKLARVVHFQRKMKNIKQGSLYKILNSKQIKSKKIEATTLDGVKDFQVRHLSYLSTEKVKIQAR